MKDPSRFQLEIENVSNKKTQRRKLRRDNQKLKKLGKDRREMPIQLVITVPMGTLIIDPPIWVIRSPFENSLRRLQQLYVSSESDQARYFYMGDIVKFDVPGFLAFFIGHTIDSIRMLGSVIRQTEPILPHDMNLNIVWQMIRSEILSWRRSSRQYAKKIKVKLYGNAGLANSYRLEQLYRLFLQNRSLWLDIILKTYHPIDSIDKVSQCSMIFDKLKLY